VEENRVILMCAAAHLLISFLKDNAATFIAMLIAVGVAAEKMVGDWSGNLLFILFSELENNGPFKFPMWPVYFVYHAEYIHAGDHYRELKHMDGGFVANRKASSDSKKPLN